MKCPNCKSQDLRRSRRNGFKESVLYRLVLLAPFRCPQCHHRLYATTLNRRSKRRQKQHSLAELIGIKKSAQGKFRRGAMALGLGTLLLLTAIILLDYLIP